jgi:hypothetical protein
MKQIFSIRTLLSFAALSAVVALSACGSDSTGTSVPTATGIAAATTPAASAQVATAIPGPSVTVTSGSAPAAGVLVTFAVTAGGGALEYPVATTDANGVASSGLWQIGPAVGVNTATAAVTGVAPLTFTVTSTPGPASKISAQAGNGQSGAPGSTLPTPLTARIADAGGNPKPGVAVTFAVTLGGGSIAGASATTNASGDATSGAWTLGTGQCLQKATATSGTLSTLFTASSRSTLTVGGSAAGTLSSSDCVIGGAFTDEYDLTTTAGAINVALTSTATGATASALTADASVPIASDPLLFRLITAANSKTIAVSAPGGATGAYTVSVASASSDNSDCSTLYLEVGASSDQTLATTDCKTNYKGVAGDAFLVYIPAGITIRFSQTAIPLDALLALYDPTGKFIVERDNGGVGASGTEVINFTATVSGYHKIIASSYCLVYNDPYTSTCSYGAYTISVIKP